MVQVEADCAPGRVVSHRVLTAGVSGLLEGDLLGALVEGKVPVVFILAILLEPKLAVRIWQKLVLVESVADRM